MLLLNVYLKGICVEDIKKSLTSFKGQYQEKYKFPSRNKTSKCINNNYNNIN